MIAEGEVPAWVLGDVRTNVTAIDHENRQLSLFAGYSNIRVQFAQVPNGWTILTTTQFRGGNLWVEVARQGSDVSWTFDLGPYIKLNLPARLTRARVTCRDANSVRTINWMRGSGSISLSDGTYVINMGESGEGAVRIKRYVDERTEARHLAIAGSAKVEEIGGQGTTQVTVDKVASALKVLAGAGPVTVTHPCTDLEALGASQIRLDAGASGNLDVSCDKFVCNNLSATGRVEAKTLHVDGEVGPATGRLKLVTDGEIWCSSGATNTDFDLAQSGQIRPVLILGTNSPSHRVKTINGPAGSGQPLEPTRIEVNGSAASDYPSPHNPWPQYFKCTITGTGDVEVAGHLESTEVDINGSLTSAGSFRCGTEPNDSVWLHANDVFLGQYLDLAGGEARVHNRLHTASILNTTLSAADESLVVASHEIRNCFVRARVISVRPSDEVSGHVIDSVLTGRDQLHLAGVVEGKSEIYAHGEASFSGSFASESAMHWDLSSRASLEHAPTLVLNDLIRGLLITKAMGHGPRPLIKMEQNAGIDHLEVSGALGIRTAEGVPFDGVDTLALMPGADLILEGYSPDIPNLLVEESAELKIVGDPESRSMSLGLRAASPNAKLRLDATNGEVTVVAPRKSGSEGLAPRLTVGHGRFRIETLVPEVACAPQGSEMVSLHVAETGRVQHLVGPFSLHGLTGRLQGTANGRSARVAQLRSWPSQSISSASLGGVGQLIDVDITNVPAGDVANLASLHVLSPLGRPLITYARRLGPYGNGKLLAYKHVFGKSFGPATHDNIRAEAQRLKEIADLVRTRANSGHTYTAAQWAAAHSHALQVKWFSGERLLRFLHRWVGYGVRPLPAFVTYLAWNVGLGTILYFCDRDPGKLEGSPDFREGVYNFWDSCLRAFLLPAGVLRSDVGGATPYRPILDHPAAHFGAVVMTGVIVGFLAVALKNFLLRPKSDN